jgi:hypothetical protein
MQTRSRLPLIRQSQFCGLLQLLSTYNDTMQFQDKASLAAGDLLRKIKFDLVQQNDEQTLNLPTSNQQSTAKQTLLLREHVHMKEKTRHYETANIKRSITIIRPFKL